MSNRGPKPTDPEVRFFGKVKISGDCWIWTGTQTGKGYGQFYAEGRSFRAHRWAYEHFVGPIPSGYVVDHFDCYRHDCVNPSHLRAVTAVENNQNREGANKDSTLGVRNVWWNSREGKFQVEVRVAGKTTYGGRYLTLEDAEVAAELLRSELMTGIPPSRRGLEGTVSLAPAQCSAIGRKTGKRCKRNTVGTAGRCYMHVEAEEAA